MYKIDISLFEEVLRKNLADSLSLEIKEHLFKLAGSRVTEEGILIVEAKRYRTQEQSRLDAIQRLVALVQETPKVREKNRPSVTSSAAQLDEKKRRGVIKRTKKFTPTDWE